MATNIFIRQKCRFVLFFKILYHESLKVDSARTVQRYWGLIKCTILHGFLTPISIIFSGGDFKL